MTSTIAKPTPRSARKQDRLHGAAVRLKATRPYDDHRLIRNCLSGDRTAWEALFQRCQPALIMVTKLLLRSDSSDPNLVDEIAGRVWYAIVTDPVRRLASFDPSRGFSLTTFLAGLARNEIRDYFRSERCRSVREKTASRAERNPVRNSNRQMSLLIDEFLDLLTPREKLFLQCHLLTSPNDQSPVFTKTNTWQLRHRIRRKLSAFLEDL